MPSTSTGTRRGRHGSLCRSCSGTAWPSTSPSRVSRARRLAAISRSSSSTTSTISELSSSSRRPRSASSSAFSIIGVSMAKVLIVEDDGVIAQAMAHHLSLAGYDPVVVSDGDTGLKRLRFETPDVCVVDLMLPRMDGWRLIEAARAEGLGTPIIVVSARGTEHDRVHALEIGADDYLVKPFSMKELVARVQVASRRGGREQTEERGEPIEIEELRIDPLNVQAYLDGRERRPDADRVPAALRPRARARPGRQPRRAAPEALGPTRGPSRPHRRRLRAQAARQDRPPGAAAHVHPDPLRRRLQARTGAEVAAR